MTKETIKYDATWMPYPKYNPDNGTVHLVTVDYSEWGDVIVAEYDADEWYERYSGDKITEYVRAYSLSEIPDEYFPVEEQ